jgi:hypothetical protein
VAVLQEPRDEAGEGHPERLLLLLLPMKLQVERMLLQVQLQQLLGAMPYRMVHRPPPLLLQQMQPQMPQTTKLHHLRKTHQSSRTSPKPTSTGTSS